jgi:hypothetical protein
VCAADGEHQQHGVQPDERDRPAPRAAERARGVRDQRDRGEARGDGERLERPQRAADAERHGCVAQQREQRSVGRVLVRPAEEREDFVGGGARGNVRVGVEAVQRTEPGEADVAEHVLRDQRRTEQQDRVRERDRDPQPAQRDRARAQQHEHIARAHQQRQRLKRARAEGVYVQVAERPRQPWRPAAAARGHVLRRLRRGCRRGQKHRDDDAEHPEHPDRAGQARAIGAGRARRSPPRAWRRGCLDRRAAGGRGALHRPIVAARRGQAFGEECRIHPTRV